MKRIATVLVLLNLAMFSEVSFSQAQAKKYKNCTELRKEFPKGVAGTKSAARKTGASYEPKVYSANKAKDRDKDGAACES